MVVVDKLMEAIIVGWDIHNYWNVMKAAGSV